MKNIEQIYNRIKAYEIVLEQYKKEGKFASYRRLAHKLNELYWVTNQRKIEVNYAN